MGNFEKFRKPAPLQGPLSPVKEQAPMMAPQASGGREWRAGGPGKSNPTTFYDLGWQFLTGMGPRHQVFGQNDPATQTLKSAPNQVRLRNYIAEGKAPVGEWKPWDNNIGGHRNAAVFGSQAASLATGGRAGNLADTYLGSYDVEFKVDKVDDKGVADVQVHAFNTSDMKSATHPPVIGYLAPWQDYVEPVVQKYLTPKSGPLSSTRQDFYWNERVPTR